MNSWDMERRVTGTTAPTVPAWAVFTAEEGEEEMWTQRVHLWAHTQTALNADVAASEEFLGREVPPARYEIQGMVFQDGYLVLVREAADWLFVRYSESEDPAIDEDLHDAIRSARRRFAREMGALDEAATSK